MGAPTRQMRMILIITCKCVLFANRNGSHLQMRMILIQSQSGALRQSAKPKCKSDGRAHYTVRNRFCQVFFSKLHKIILNSLFLAGPQTRPGSISEKREFVKIYFQKAPAAGCAEVQKLCAKSMRCARRTARNPMRILYHTRTWKVKNYFKFS